MRVTASGLRTLLHRSFTVRLQAQKMWMISSVWIRSRWMPQDSGHYFIVRLQSVYRLEGERNAEKGQEKRKGTDKRLKPKDKESCKDSGKPMLINACVNQCVY